jgi:hypothetical protein
MTSHEIHEKFHYHPPTTSGAATHRELSRGFCELAEKVEMLCPDGREKALAMTNLEQAKMWASAAVARDPATR